MSKKPETPDDSRLGSSPRYPRLVRVMDDFRLPVKALTISQPFATLIADGEKWIENRSWPTSYRGVLAIHAGKGTQYLDRGQLAEYPTGCVVAVGNLTACVKLERIRQMNQESAQRKKRIPGTNRYWSEAARHRHAEGPWCWILEDVKPCEVVLCRGAQGLWDFRG